MDDPFFYVVEWPTYIQEIVLDKQFIYSQRCALAAFFVGNELSDPDVAEKIYKIYNIHWNNSRKWTERFREFRLLFAYFIKPKTEPDSYRIGQNYYYYCMRTNRNLNLDGTVKKSKKFA